MTLWFILIFLLCFCEIHAVDFVSQIIMDYFTIAFLAKIRRRHDVFATSHWSKYSPGGDEMKSSVLIGCRSTTLSTQNAVLCENIVLQRRNVIVLSMRYVYFIICLRLSHACCNCWVLSTYEQARRPNTRTCSRVKNICWLLLTYLLTYLLAINIGFLQQQRSHV